MSDVCSDETFKLRDEHVIGSHSYVLASPSEAGSGPLWCRDNDAVELAAKPINENEPSN